MNDSHNTTNKFIPIRFGKLFNVQIDGLKLKLMSIDIKSPRPFPPPSHTPPFWIIHNKSNEQKSLRGYGITHCRFFKKSSLDKFVHPFGHGEQDEH